MAHGFDDYRVFVAAPGDLEADRVACHEAISRINATTAMPEKVLLVTVGLREAGQIESNRSIVSDNVRWSSYFIQLFEDDWGPRDLYRKLFLLAVDCRDNTEMPMRNVVVFLKDAPHETDARVLEFRKELEERNDMQVCRYKTTQELNTQLEEVLRGWAHELIAHKIAAQTTEAASLP